LPDDGALEHDKERDAQAISDAWLLALEGATYAPVDVGLQASLELPVGLRVSGGYGFTPSKYVEWLTKAGASASGTDALTLLASGFESGRVWRVQAGIRPFRKLGLYLDGGYAQLHLKGALDAAVLGNVAGAGTYEAASTIRMWQLVLGYQASIANHLVLAIGAGVLFTKDAKTTLRGPGIDASFASKATEAFDETLERYGVMPTLTVRLGFDFI
jgi:hypothetical protein